MIKINMLSSLNKAVAEARNEIRSRSFSGRNPQLGRMINCHICGRRHRETQIIAGKIYKCELHYSVGRWDPDNRPLIASQTTLKGVMGAQRFARKRLNPHFSSKALQLVQRTQQLYPQHAAYLNDPKEVMHEARTQAYRELKAERAEEGRFKRKQQDTATRINRGLEKNGVRA